MAELPRHLKPQPGDTPMERIMRKLGRSTSNVAIRTKGSQDPFTMWELNMAIAAPHVSQQAIILTQRYYREITEGDDEQYSEDMKVLDYIAKFYLAYNALALDDRKEAMSGFSELYSYLEGERARQIYAYFTASFVQSVYCYIYTTKSMGLAISRGIGKDAAELTDTYCIMSQLSDETRRQVYKELREQGYMPGSDLEPIKRNTLKFTQIIEGEQEYEQRLQMEAMQAKKKGKNKRKK